MKLLYSPSSPYSAKVVMAASYLGIPLDLIQVATADEPSLLTDANPLGKIPTLIPDAGEAIFDSRAIMHFLDRDSGRKLYPRKDSKRTEAEVLEALCDGIMDSLVAIVYERRFRPEDKVHQPAIDKQWRKVTRGLDWLDANLPKTGKTLHGGHFSMAAMIGYLLLRFPGQWEDGRVALAAWTGKFSKRFPAFHDLKPRA
ncbi:glutathione S-transferase [Ciceribacter sp. L1K22]|uniref:glutathione S-transferase n=1 Tax=Ciceribacter sp. L1K22 TaxID=2820275 RepID=UPI001ABE7E4F|nr:glutathione S-transferase [Ciceribacter sp. L1K22]MBO3759722.1 glutathione S-transferase [Ciceribacter sp. L1K22]